MNGTFSSLAPQTHHSKSDSCASRRRKALKCSFSTASASSFASSSHSASPSSFLNQHSEGGFFKARLTFPKSYPQMPPKLQFTSEMWHPNGTFGERGTRQNV